MKRRDFLAAGVAAATPLPAFAGVTDVVLQNERWRIRIRPYDLNLSVEPTGRPPILASSGIGTRSVTNLSATSDRAAWTWDGGYAVTCTLDGLDVRVTITATAPGDLVVIDQPPEAFGRGMIYPRAEGHYIPAGDALWQDYLTNRDNDTDTSQGLSLPLWGQDHGDCVLSWLLLNPFNNQLSFTAAGDVVALRLTHSFTSLAPDTPMEMLLHLGEGATSGARRYRQHLIETGTYESLASKIARTPSCVGLIGASHTYLWGTGLLSTGDVRDWNAFQVALSGPSDMATGLRAELDKETLDLVGGKPIEAWQQGALIWAFNDALAAMARKHWQVDDIDFDVLVGCYGELRQQVATVFANALHPDPATWGDGLSKTTLKTLQKAGLNKLWIGLGDGWEGGLWHPETVVDFAKAGYLIGPYDSYETAVMPGKRPDWATAQLGKDAFQNAGVIKKNGSVTAGFQQTGVYTNTLTVTPILKARIAALAKATHFNSWFLDVYATGMVFDDYRPGHEMTMAQNAKADSDAMRWVGETMQLPIGSEDGNATTTPGVMFSHGMQTPVMGWGDPDLQQDKASPYYLGNWFPANQPGIFFKTVPLKERYRALHFRPETRLPLYQTVFHGSVITTHHWSYDSLKFNNVRPWSELAQLLYNVPPLYHLSAQTLKSRLPVMAKQHAFFRPLHEALALKTLDGFAWLSDDRQVQMTTFEDGSRLIANFDTAPRSADGRDLPPASLTAMLAGQPPQVYLAT